MTRLIRFPMVELFHTISTLQPIRRFTRFPMVELFQTTSMLQRMRRFTRFTRFPKAAND